MTIEINPYDLLVLLWLAFAVGLFGGALMRGADRYLTDFHPPRRLP